MALFVLRAVLGGDAHPVTDRKLLKVRSQFIALRAPQHS
jgi:hypothetical protein